MKDLRIYSVDEVQEPLLLKLSHNGSCGVMLEAVDLGGRPILTGALLTITANGFLQLNSGISEDLELPLDDEGRLKIVRSIDQDPVTFSDDEVRALHRIIDRLKSALRTVSTPSDREQLLLEREVFTKITQSLGYSFT